MRRILLVTLIALFTLALAGPALAQDIPQGARDPFEPLLVQDSSGATGAAISGTSPGTTTSGAPNTGISGGLSNTGADTSPWIAAAYLLITFGAAGVVWARVRAPLTR